MKEIFLLLLSQLNSGVLVLLLLIVIMFVLTYIIASIKTKFSADSQHANEKLTKLENLHDIVIEIKTKVNLLYQQGNPNSPVKNNSPLALTDVGISIKDKINAQDIFKRLLGDLEREIEKETLMNAYDIQQSAISVTKNNIEKKLSNEELLIIKNEAYSNGILVEDVMLIFGILLRDHILAKKGMSILEVDDHAPD